MKYITIIFIFSLFNLYGCSDDETFLLSEGIRNNPVSPLEKMTVKSYNKHFLTDYPLYLTPGIKSKPLGKDYFQRMMSIEASSHDEWQSVYPAAKQLFTDLLTQPVEGRKLHAQEIGLKLLREYLLVEPVTQDKKVEIVFLLNGLMAANAIDLDVLTDAFLVAKQELTPAVQKDYYEQLKSLFFSQETSLAADFSEAKNKYDNAVDENSRLFAIMSGKRVERVSRSCKYANNKLHFRGKE